MPNFSRATEPCSPLDCKDFLFGRGVEPLAYCWECPQAVRSAGLGRRFGGISVVAHAVGVRAELPKENYVHFAQFAEAALPNVKKIKQTLFNQKRNKNLTIFAGLKKQTDDK
ncbi:MAG: hypothetical protein J5862_01270 [Bacteroidales bacterium]|nr:hypothetical protein [Bacteroidales bacterium]